MAINSVNELAGFDQYLYDYMKTSYIKSTGKTEGDFEALVLSVSDNGKLPFMDVVDEIRDLLASPQSDINYSSLSAVPSFGSTYLALITELSSEQRRQNAEMRALQTEEMASKIEEQAETIREKAVVQLVTGVVTGVLSIAQGVASVSITAKGMVSNEQTAKTAYNSSIESSTGGGTKPIVGEQAMNAALEKADNAATLARQQADMMLNTRVQAFNSGMGGANSILGSIGQCVSTMYDAELKELEGDVERIRAQQQNLESLDESLKALIQKSISSQDAIQQNINQTRTKILG